MNNKRKIKRLKELADIKIGLPLERKKANPISLDKIEYKLLTLKSFTATDDFNDLYDETFIADSHINSQYLTKVNDVIVRLRAPTTAIHISSKNADLVVPSLMAIVTNIDVSILDSKYLTYYLNSQLIQNQLIKNSQGTSITMTKRTDLLELEINLPPLEKQQKIVNYIDTANKEIGLLNKLIDEKNKLKTEIFETLIK
ncbi:MAG TPA: restriction endonuclease subunit S [Burkholderiales bacterium]|nr:restriction endonuclease subunit S [Burkholderiales bacterium]